MSNYVYGSGISYLQYLQAKSFVSDISSASRKAGREVSMEISRQTRAIIASNEALARENIRVIERQNRESLNAIDAASDRITGALSEGFDRVTYQLQDISAGISELNATFHWGFSQMIASIGHMNDALSELIKIAKTPVQTVAFNHFEIARNAFRQGLYQEALEELSKAIQGDHTSPGYKLEWRFHQMMGTIRLGFVDCDLSLVDLAQAEESFLLATRYAKTDYPEDAARAFLSAGWAAYCQGKMKEALAQTEQAIALSPKLTEAFFQAAKVRMALGEVDSALPILRQAIDRDHFYILKAAGDGDFQKHNDKLHDFLEALHQEKYQQVAQKVQAALKNIKFWRKHFSEAKNNAYLQQMDCFLSEGAEWPLFDLCMPSINSVINKILLKAKETFIIITTKLAGFSYSKPESYQEKESYEEEVIIKPAGFFRKPVTEIQTKTRIITKTRTVTQTLNTIKDDIYSGLGKLITSIEFCQIPAGKFIMNWERKQRQVTIHKGFFIGKYTVTQRQWKAIMGKNPSFFKRSLNLPVEEVSWYDCQTFIRELNRIAGKNLYRLPTKKEWEYACRADSITEYYFGDNSNLLDQYAWHQKNSDNKTHPVGLFKPNAWSLYDMLGNIWEWTSSYSSLIKEYRITCGGSYSSSEDRCKSENIFPPDSTFSDLGFRLVRLKQI